ncbi:unnamed protein product [Ceratitis capitata]|uniref:(Mediterranean fruit fly) hypothetical protein n=1 Tax=Ceratitis capitata TaxID=7213 RepID=A0A811UI07_CERCA|nr:unnamed protein product [Ceratitis capitata]
MDPQKITELARLLRRNGDKILSSEFSLTLSGSLLRALNDSFTLITDGAVEIGTSTQTFQVAKPVNSRSPVFIDLQLIYDFVQKAPLLCIVQYPTDEYFDGTIDISKFRALRRLELQKTNVRQVVGIQRLRAQLQQLICVKSLTGVEDVITRCGGDNSNGFVWNELKIADFSYNNLQRIDNALEFAQFLQHLNLRHNKLRSVEAIKWLPHLKNLDLSYNCLQCVPQFHMEAYKRLQTLNMSNNFVEDLMGIAKLDALTDLDLSDNCLLDHTSTAQFLHKNTATVKFLLDLEPLSKSEKSVTGSQQLRHVGALNRYAQRSSSTSINSSRVPSSTQTPSSSVGSLRSFNFNDNTSQPIDAVKAVEGTTGIRKSASKVRTVDIMEDEDTTTHTPDERDEAVLAEKLKPIKVTPEREHISEQDTQHLEAKKQIETLREKYGANWLQSGNAEMLQSVLGTESANDMPVGTPTTANSSRKMLDDFLGELSESALAAANSTKLQNTSNETLNYKLNSSTPVSDSYLGGEVSKLEVLPSPIQSSAARDNRDATLYQSMNSTNGNQTLYKSADSELALMRTAADSSNSAIEEANTSDADVDKLEENDDDEPAHLKNVYANAGDEESEASEAEDDEETYIVYTMPRNEAVFLTISENYLRIRDTLTQKTITKWSLQILESCDRIKSNTIRINFDTIRADKRERIYTVEDGLCQELERKLRDILSQRDLTEMNQTVYRCVNCTCQFAVETKYKSHHQSSFVAEIHDIPKPKMDLVAEKLSPAAIVEETTLLSTNTPPTSRAVTKLQYSGASLANITTAGSNENDTNSIEREFGSAARAAALETQAFVEESKKSAAKEAAVKTNTPVTAANSAATITVAPANVQLIESSSSGSVTDSVCTAYEQRQQQEEELLPATHSYDELLSRSAEQAILRNLLAAESLASHTPAVTEVKAKSANGTANGKPLPKKDDGGVVSSMFGALVQTTNNLMSSSRKSHTQTNQNQAVGDNNCQPYKYNYTDFNDVDHRLKLYFFQTKFDENEQFKWLARGRIFNEQTKRLAPASL